MTSALMYTREELLTMKRTVNKEEINPTMLQKLQALDICVPSARQNMVKNVKLDPPADPWTTIKPRGNPGYRAPYRKDGPPRNPRFSAENQGLRAPRWGHKKQTPTDRYIPREEESQQWRAQNEERPTPQPVEAEDVIVHKAEKAWKPRQRNADPVAAKAKEFRGLLNKITPTTFEELAKKFLGEEVFKHAEVLPLVVDIIFDKAVEEPTFCPLYSDLCARQVQQEKESADSAFFRNSIIRRCQETFSAEAKVVFEEKLAAVRQEMAEKETALLEERIKELTAKERRRIIGNIGLMAQLNRIGLLNLRIIGFALNTLLKASSEDRSDEASIECAIKLITDVGRGWESQRRAQRKKLPRGASQTQVEAELNLVAYVHYLEQKAKSFCNRLRFAVQDLVDLKDNAWEPRKSQAQKGPKKVEELRAEIRQEKIQNAKEREDFELQKKKEKAFRPARNTRRR